MVTWGVWDDANDLSRQAYFLLQHRLGFEPAEKGVSFHRQRGTEAEAESTTRSHEEIVETRCHSLLLNHPRLFYSCLSDVVDSLEEESALPARLRMGRTVGLALEVYHLYNRETPRGQETFDPNFPSALREKCKSHVQTLSRNEEVLAGGWKEPEERLAALRQELIIFS